MDSSRASPSLDLMHHAATVTPLPDEQSAPADLPEKISAYFSLTFPNFTYYIQTISIAIGRRAARDSSPSSSDAHQVDVDLGPLRSVSRLHAKIEYEETQERFVLVVLGRNGAWVDGIWSGSGSRVPLGAKSQIQIATRVFDFVLPPPPAPEDSPSVSSRESSNRHYSPALDTISSSPNSSVHSPPPAKEIELPDAEEITGSALLEEKKPLLVTKSSNKKRKKCGDGRPPPPDVMPERPQLTYAQLCYRAIKSMDGKATLQEICAWISDNYDWYRYNEGNTWESSVRHNLSSNPAFVKMERCAGERGKGFFWSIDPLREKSLKEQDSKAGLDGKNRLKNGKLLEPPLKRSVKGEAKTSLTPQPPATSSPVPDSSPKTTFILETPGDRKEPDKFVPKTTTQPDAEAVVVSSSQLPNPPTTTSSVPSMSTDVVIPIVIGKPTTPTPAPLPEGIETPAASKGTLDLSTPPIALQNNQIVLNPTIFSSLTPVHLKELESLGARKAVEILQTYIVRYLKEKRKSEKKEKKKEKKEKKRKDAASQDGTPALGVKAEMEDTKESVPKVDPAPSVNTPPPSEGISPPVLTPASDLTQAVAPLRISSPPSAGMHHESAVSTDILVSTNEPATKRRRLDAVVASQDVSA